MTAEFDAGDIAWPLATFDNITRINFGYGWMTVPPAGGVDLNEPHWTIRWTASGLISVEPPDGVVPLVGPESPDHPPEEK